MKTWKRASKLNLKRIHLLGNTSEHLETSNFIWKQIKSLERWKSLPVFYHWLMPCPTLKNLVKSIQVKLILTVNWSCRVSTQVICSWEDFLQQCSIVSIFSQIGPEYQGKTRKQEGNWGTSGMVLKLRDTWGLSWGTRAKWEKKIGTRNIKGELE